MAESKMLTGLFRDRESAERAYQSAMQRGYAGKDINLVMSDETRKRHFAPTVERTPFATKAAEGAGIGSAVGGTLGAIAAAIAAMGTSVVIPGLGLAVAGPLAAALAGAGAGAATGGFIGALIGWGVPEERVERYESGIKQGGILLGIKPRSAEDAQHLEKTWREHHAEDVHW